MKYEQPKEDRLFRALVVPIVLVLAAWVYVMLAIGYLVRKLRSRKK